MAFSNLLGLQVLSLSMMITAGDRGRPQHRSPPAPSALAQAPRRAHGRDRGEVGPRKEQAPVEKQDGAGQGVTPPLAAALLVDQENASPAPMPSGPKTASWQVIVFTPLAMASWPWSAPEWVLPLLVGVLLTAVAWALSRRREIRDVTGVFLERLQRIVLESTGYERERNALRESEARFRQLAENMRDIVWIVSLNPARTLFVNSAFEEITGRTRQSLYERPNCLDLIHPEDRAEAVLTLFRQVLEEYQGDAEFRIVRPDGTIRWLRCRAFSILRDRGETNRVGCIAEDITERKRSEQDLRQLSGRLLRLQDEERRRMARELHDSAAQMLAALMMNLGSLQTAAARLSVKGRRALAESQDLAKQCLAELRTVSYLLHPPLLEELGLVSALRHYLDGFTQRSGLQVELEVAPDFGRWPQEIELALFRVVQESLTNIHRHSGSAAARVRLKRGAGGVTLEVRDEGRGMPPESLDRTKQIVPGLGVGIAGMQERLKHLGGRLEIESSTQGTTIRAIVPLPTG